MRFAVIIAGGSGTRLWPMSVTRRPKQLLRIVSGRSLLNIAAGRLRGLIEPAHLYVCTLAQHVAAVMDDLATLPLSQLIGEPMGRDTASAIGLSAAVLQKRDPEAIMAVFTADHVIEPIAVFQAAVEMAFQAVERHPDVLVTFGIKPTHAATGYGYVQRAAPMMGLDGVYGVAGFREKPDAATATKYVESGDYFWNSGMFVWKAATILEQLRTHLPQTHDGVMKIAAAWDTPDQQAVLSQIYPALPKISIDFAVLEKASQVAVVPMDVEWLDIGSWSSFMQTLPADETGSRTAGDGPTVMVNCANSLALSQDDHLIAMLGVENMIVVHTPQATMICPVGQSENLKRLVEQVQKSFGHKFV